MTKEIEVKRPRGRPRVVSKETGAPAKALDKGLLTLKAIAETDGISLNDLAINLDMPQPTVYRLLATLESHRFVTQSKTDASWSIGIEAFRVGSAFPRAAKLLNLARPILRELAQKTGETANLGVLDGSEVIFIAQHETHHAIRAFFRPGSRASWHASGIGKVIVSFSDIQSRQGLLKKGPFEQFTQTTKIQPSEFSEEFKRIKSLGYSFDDEERYLGMRCVAAPVFDSQNQLVAGVSISGPTARIINKEIPHLGRLTLKAGEELSKSLGASLTC
ncbi:IclR family transcriptional regulator [Litorivicinus sp.]|nr:IclR family transcriptional regulator [Litorivicinus sp.]